MSQSTLQEIIRLGKEHDELAKTLNAENKLQVINVLADNEAEVSRLYVRYVTEQCQQDPSALTDDRFACLEKYAAEISALPGIIPDVIQQQTNRLKAMVAASTKDEIVEFGLKRQELLNRPNADPTIDDITIRELDYNLSHIGYLFVRYALEQCQLNAPTFTHPDRNSQFACLDRCANEVKEIPGVYDRYIQKLVDGIKKALGNNDTSIFDNIGITEKLSLTNPFMVPSRTERTRTPFVNESLAVSDFRTSDVLERQRRRLHGEAAQMAIDNAPLFNTKLSPTPPSLSSIPIQNETDQEERLARKRQYAASRNQLKRSAFESLPLIVPENADQELEYDPLLNDLNNNMQHIQNVVFVDESPDNYTFEDFEEEEELPEQEDIETVPLTEPVDQEGNYYTPPPIQMISFDDDIEERLVQAKIDTCIYQNRYKSRDELLACLNALRIIDPKTKQDMFTNTLIDIWIRDHTVITPTSPTQALEEELALFTRNDTANENVAVAVELASSSNAIPTPPNISTLEIEMNRELRRLDTYPKRIAYLKQLEKSAAVFPGETDEQLIQYKISKGILVRNKIDELIAQDEAKDPNIDSILAGCDEVITTDKKIECIKQSLDVLPRSSPNRDVLLKRLQALEDQLYDQEIRPQNYNPVSSIQQFFSKFTKKPAAITDPEDWGLATETPSTTAKMVKQPVLEYKPDVAVIPPPIISPFEKETLHMLRLFKTFGEKILFLEGLKEGIQPNATDNENDRAIKIQKNLIIDKIIADLQEIEEDDYRPLVFKLTPESKTLEVNPKTNTPPLPRHAETIYFPGIHKVSKLEPIPPPATSLSPIPNVYDKYEYPEMSELNINLADVPASTIEQEIRKCQAGEATKKQKLECLQHILTRHGDYEPNVTLVQNAAQEIIQQENLKYINRIIYHCKLKYLNDPLAQKQCLLNAQANSGFDTSDVFHSIQFERRLNELDDIIRNRLHQKEKDQEAAFVRSLVDQEEAKEKAKAAEIQANADRINQEEQNELLTEIEEKTAPGVLHPSQDDKNRMNAVYERVLLEDKAKREAQKILDAEKHERLENVLDDCVTVSGGERKKEIECLEDKSENLVTDITKKQNNLLDTSVDNSIYDTIQKRIKYLRERLPPTAPPFPITKPPPPPHDKKPPPPPTETDPLTDVELNQTLANLAGLAETDVQQYQRVSNIQQENGGGVLPNPSSAARQAIISSGAEIIERYGQTSKQAAIAYMQRLLEGILDWHKKYTTLITLNNQLNQTPSNEWYRKVMAYIPYSTERDRASLLVKLKQETVEAGANYLFYRQMFNNQSQSVITRFNITPAIVPIPIPMPLPIPKLIPKPTPAAPIPTPEPFVQPIPVPVPVPTPKKQSATAQLRALPAPDRQSALNTAMIMQMFDKSLPHIKTYSGWIIGTVVAIAVVGVIIAMIYFIFFYDHNNSISSNNNNIPSGDGGNCLPTSCACPVGYRPATSNEIATGNTNTSLSGASSGVSLPVAEPSNVSTTSTVLPLANTSGRFTRPRRQQQMNNAATLTPTSPPINDDQTTTGISFQ